MVGGRRIIVVGRHVDREAVVKGQWLTLTPPLRGYWKDDPNAYGIVLAVLMPEEYPGDDEALDDAPEFGLIFVPGANGFLMIGRVSSLNLFKP